MCVFKMTLTGNSVNSLRMIQGSKHVGAILSVLVKFYVSALVGVIIKVVL